MQESYTVVLVLFCCLKIFTNIFSDRVTNLISVVSVRAKRGKNLYAFTLHRKEVLKLEKQREKSRAGIGR